MIITYKTSKSKRHLSFIFTFYLLVFLVVLMMVYFQVYLCCHADAYLVLLLKSLFF